jgi:hypothetical protein
MKRATIKVNEIFSCLKKVSNSLEKNKDGTTKTIDTILEFVHNELSALKQKLLQNKEEYINNLSTINKENIHELY